jgi:hypothetical protein
VEVPLRKDGFRARSGVSALRRGEETVIRSVILALLLSGCMTLDLPTAPPVAVEPPVAVAPAPKPVPPHVAEPTKCKKCWTLTITAQNGDSSIKEGLTKARCQKLRGVELARSGMLETDGLTIRQAGGNVISAECQ